MRIEIHVPAVPVAQPRARSRGAGKGVYNPSTADAYKASVQLAARQQYQGETLEGPLSASVLFVMPRTKAWKPQERTPHTKTPDVDNLLKSTFDALNGTLWRDDRQIWVVTTRKVIAAGDEQPHVKLTIETADPAP